METFTETAEPISLKRIYRESMVAKIDTKFILTNSNGATSECLGMGTVYALSKEIFEGLITYEDASLKCKKEALIIGKVYENGAVLAVFPLSAQNNISVCKGKCINVKDKTNINVKPAEIVSIKQKPCHIFMPNEENGQCANIVFSKTNDDLIDAKSKVSNMFGKLNAKSTYCFFLDNEKFFDAVNGESKKLNKFR